MSRKKFSHFLPYFLSFSSSISSLPVPLIFSLSISLVVWFFSLTLNKWEKERKKNEKKKSKRMRKASFIVHPHQFIIRIHPLHASSHFLLFLFPFIFSSSLLFLPSFTIYFLFFSSLTFFSFPLFLKIFPRITFMIIVKINCTTFVLYSLLFWYP